MKKAIEKHRKELKKAVNDILTKKGSPNSIALGFAVGTFICILPLPFLTIWIALLLVFIFRKLNKIALFSAYVFWNPLFTAPITILSYKIGDLIVGDAPLLEYRISLFNHIFNLYRNLIIGNIILALPVSALSFIIVRQLLIYVRKKTGEKKKKR